MAPGELQPSVQSVEETTPSFPPELAELIIDELGDDVQTLKACSLVSKNFVTRCQKNLFADIVLDKFQKSSSSRLLAIFDDSPHIPSYVKSLELLGLQMWARADLDALEMLLPLLENLTSIAVRRPHEAYWNCLTEWSSLSGHLTSALISSFRSPKLQSASFDDISNFPHLATILGWFRHTMKHLSLDNIVFTQDDNTSVEDPTRAIPVDLYSLRLYVTFNRGEDARPTPPSQLSCVRKVSLWPCYDGDHQPTQRLLDTMPQLEHIDFRLDGAVFHIDLGNHYHLSSLFCSMRLDRAAPAAGIQGEPDWVAAMISMVETIPQDGSFEKLTLELRLLHKYRFPDYGWTALEAALVHASARKRRVLEFSLLPPEKVKAEEKDSYFEQFSADLKRCMPELDARGDLHIQRLEGSFFETMGVVR